MKMNLQLTRCTGIVQGKSGVSGKDRSGRTGGVKKSFMEEESLNCPSTYALSIDLSPVEKSALLGAPPLPLKQQA